MLFNLAEDVGEKKHLAKEKPEFVEHLRQRMAELDTAIGAGARPLWEKPRSEYCASRGRKEIPPNPILHLETLQRWLCFYLSRARPGRAHPTIARISSGEVRQHPPIIRAPSSHQRWAPLLNDPSQCDPPQVFVPAS